jgi:MSHA biogenesis protein MshJ
VNPLRTAFARINRASLRERALLFVAAAGLLAMLWNYMLLIPLAARRTAFSRDLDEVRDRLAASPDQDNLADQYAVLKAREAALAAGIATADGELKAAQVGMIAPTQMVPVLTFVLSHQKDLTLVLLRNLAVEPLLPPIEPSASGAPAPIELGPYVHPVELIVRGNYLNVLSYLEELESRPWGFQWRRFEFTTTTEGPQYRIEFTTLSMQSNWLGV